MAKRNCWLSRGRFRRQRGFICSTQSLRSSPYSAASKANRFLLHTLLQGIALAGPVGGETRGNHEHAEFLQAHAAEGVVGRADVGAFIKRAAAAVDDQIGRAGKRGGPGFQFRKALFRGRSEERRVGKEWRSRWWAV